MKINDYVNALPDAYKKTPDSNNYKLLQMEERLVGGLRDDMDLLFDALDIHKATGKTLDLYGESYGQARGSLTDEQYRLIILQRIARNMAKGDYNSIVKALAVAFGVTTDYVAFEETENPAEVRAENLPYTIMLNAGLTGAQIIEMLKAILPVGVKLASDLNLEGTFEFSAFDNEYNEEAGFGDFGQTIGGTLGVLVNDDSTDSGGVITDNTLLKDADGALLMSADGRHLVVLNL